MKTKPYPVPGPEGGKLIRLTIAGLRRAGVKLPVSSDILIAVSGGSDSIALAHLILKYGRRIVAPKNVVLVHVNHGWRGKASDDDEKFVANFGRKYKARVVRSQAKRNAAAGDSLEEAARVLRHEVFAKESAKKEGAWVLTAHHADDLAETVLWRLLTGAADTHGAGILPRHGRQVRPLLGVRKASLVRYLKEEKQPWREDSTNAEGRLLRSKLRLELMPVVERLFPRAVEHLTKLAFRAGHRRELADDFHGSAQGAARGRGIEDTKDTGPIDALHQAFGSLGIRARRPHWEAILEEKFRELHLPKGWRLRRDAPGRWVIDRASERSKSLDKQWE